jgi:hypothetical protein
MEPHELRKKTFTRTLEERAEDVLFSNETRDPSSPMSSIVNEIDLVLEQIHNQQDFHHEQMRELFLMETYIDTDLLRIEDRTSRYANQRFPEEEKVKRRLHDLDKERRRLKAEYQESVGKLHGKLLELMNRHDLLKG